MSSHNELPGGCMVAILIAFALPFALGGIVAKTTQETITVTISEKERAGGDSSTYLVFTNGETFKNSDSIWFWKWNSSDIYGDIEVGKTYRAKVYGFRIPILSMYRNIVSLREVTP